QRLPPSPPPADAAWPPSSSSSPQAAAIRPKTASTANTRQVRFFTDICSPSCRPPTRDGTTGAANKKQTLCCRRERTVKDRPFWSVCHEPVARPRLRDEQGRSVGILEL